MHILLTNDDGIYAPGLQALRRQLARWATVTVVAPATEQSGVGHSITLLTPLVVQEVFEGESRIGWLVEGSPADCVKLACLELLDRPPDLLISGLNHGANVGINVLYSGTVAAAVEGAFFGLRSIAVSVEFSDYPDFDLSAERATHLIQQVLEHDPPPGSLYNVNLPDPKLGPPRGVRIVPQGVVRYKEGFERRRDPRGRTYFWSKIDYIPHPHEGVTDILALADRYVTVTPLRFDLTDRAGVAEMANWNLILKDDQP